MCGSSPDPIPAPPPTAPTKTPKFGSGALFGISKDGNQELLINKNNFQNLGTRSLQINDKRKPSSTTSTVSSAPLAKINDNPLLPGKGIAGIYNMLTNDLINSGKLKKD